MYSSSAIVQRAFASGSCGGQYKGKGKTRRQFVRGVLSQLN